MNEQDITKFRKVSYINENSYYRIELYESKTGLWRGFKIENEELKDALLPHLFSWNVTVCFHCNYLYLLFPYRNETPLSAVLKQTKDFDTGVQLFQKLFLKLQYEGIPPAILQILCDQKNLAIDEQGNWQLYANPRLEQLCHHRTNDPRMWQKLCAQAIENIRDIYYHKLPEPKLYETFKEHMSQEAGCSFDEMLHQLELLNGCYRGVIAPVSCYRKWLHIVNVSILIMMLVLSIAFFVFEYIKQQEAFFRNIDVIGDVVVNGNE